MTRGVNRAARRGLVTALVAGGVLAPAGFASADASAGGDTADSPGVVSGNSVQVPVHLPINLCGNTVDVVGLLNPAAGNACTNSSAHAAGSAAGGRQGSGARADGHTSGSPGAVSGNEVQLPIDLPVNISGNSVDVVGIGNPAVGNTSSNTGVGNPGPAPVVQPPAHRPVPAPPNEPPAVPSNGPQTGDRTDDPILAQTGAEGLGWAVAGSAALLLGGAVLLRRVGRRGPAVPAMREGSPDGR
ncbi:chaplin [Actinacidiphila acididurans]|uniref:Chaplin n=1 Tax=Actinacidiphila acididurans TaxID=2784346 RepID=A0ABS2TXU8_9ACTN|nr:chaplin [Actinacidiphila acididurans]MBM9508164.1 chaplin [Actinacidiphila acididurans]